MKISFFIFSFITFLNFFIFSTSSFLYAQYDSEGNHFEDSTKISKALVTTATHKVNFKAPQDTIYIYHLVAEIEDIEFILNLYQLCAPCFAEWNNYSYSGVKNLKRQQLYIGEYLKVALKKDYHKGFLSNPIFIYKYVETEQNISPYVISELYGISVEQLIEWNNHNEYVYSAEGKPKIIIDKKVYKYVCPCRNEK
jgi:LysM repeat protein